MGQSCSKPPVTDLVPFGINQGLILAEKLVEVQPEVAQPPSKSANKGNKEETRRKHKKQRRLLQAKDMLPLVDEWIELEDRETKRIYYHSKRTGKSVWSKPDGFDEAQSLVAEDERKRGTYWIKVEDSKGRTFYYDLLTKTTRWDKPTQGYFEPPKKENKRKSSVSQPEPDSEPQEVTQPSL